ncbi:hypothetical protein FP359_24415 [Klebsiella variicola]|uniref:ParB family protein n=1 Tax=Klebsiella variicola TaxID=244366 RepID=UPI001C941D7E|nr:ParB family protein [Klebsiella variicola]MBY5172994.1 hypothetical protein [Klebsiella variicola]
MKTHNIARINGAGSQLTAAFMERVQQSALPAAPQPVSVTPAEIPMILTLDELRPNPDNPRKQRNPRYDDIKASIARRGLDSVPKVTKNPATPDYFIFSDGGNTRYAILRELWEETRDERFYRLTCYVKPWPGRLMCLLGHLAENDLQGKLSFIDRAKGIADARVLYEQESDQRLSLRTFSTLLDRDGYRLDSSEIQRMEYSLQYLYPVFPRLFDNGMGRPQARSLIRLHRALADSADSNPTIVDKDKLFTLFNATATQFDDPDIWSFEAFEDALLSALGDSSGHSPDWWKLILSGETALHSPPTLPPPSEADFQTGQPPVMQTLAPAETPAVLSAGTAPGTEVRTAGLTLNELADAHQTADTPPASAHDDPRLAEDYREEQLALRGVNATPPENSPSASSLPSQTLDARSVSRLRTLLLRDAYALADMASVTHCLVSDESSDQPGFRVVIPHDMSDVSGVATFLLELCNGSDTLSFPLRWLGGDNVSAPCFDNALSLATGLITGIAQFRAWIRDQKADATLPGENSL